MCKCAEREFGQTAHCRIGRLVGNGGKTRPHKLNHTHLPQCLVVQIHITCWFWYEVIIVYLHKACPVPCLPAQSLSCTMLTRTKLVMHYAYLHKAYHAPCLSAHSLSCTMLTCTKLTMHHAYLHKACHAPCLPAQSSSCTMFTTPLRFWNVGESQ